MMLLHRHLNNMAAQGTLWLASRDSWLRDRAQCLSHDCIHGSPPRTITMAYPPDLSDRSDLSTATRVERSARISFCFRVAMGCQAATTSNLGLVEDGQLSHYSLTLLLIFAIFLPRQVLVLISSLTRFTLYACVEHELQCCIHIMLTTVATIP